MKMTLSNDTLVVEKGQAHLRKVDIATTTASQQQEAGCIYYAESDSLFHSHTPGLPKLEKYARLQLNKYR